MLDTLGFHTDTDHQAELDALNAEIAELTEQIRADRFYSPEARTNAYLKLGSLHRRVPDLEWNAEIEKQRLEWIADGVRLVGDAALGVIAYVVFGTSVLPC